MNLRALFTAARVKRVGLFALSSVLVLWVSGMILWKLLQPTRLEVPARSDLALHNVHVVNPGVNRLDGQTLTTKDGTIAGLAPTPGDSTGEGPFDGMYVLPGLIDMHVHFPPTIAAGNQELWALMFLAHGVTAVRDMGSADGSIFAFRERARAGRVPAPRIFACGAMLDGSPAAFPSNRVVETPEEARRAVDDLAAAGADHIKAYHMLSAECLRAIRERAQEHGLRVVGHVPLSTPVELGLVQDVQHLTGIPIPSDLEDLIDDRAEWSLMDALAIDDARIDELIAAFLKNGTAFTPTMINPRMRRKQCGPLSDPQDAALAIVPRLWPGVWKFVFGTPYTPGSEWETRYEQQRDKYKEVTFKFHEAGVEIHAGTDTMMPCVVPGKSLHGELEELVYAGLSVEDAWRAATTRPGAYLADSGLGTVKTGAPADFLIFSQDPTKSLDALDSLVAVVADGRVYTREYLDAAVERYRAHFHGRLYDTLMAAPIAVMQRVYAP